MHSVGSAFSVPEHDLLLVKCQRIMTQQGDLEALGVREHHHLPERLSLEDTLQAIEDEGALVNLPNPFHRRGSGPYFRAHPQLLEKVHAVTVYSGEGALWIPHLVPRDGVENPNTLALLFYGEMKRSFPHLGAVTASNGSLVRHIGTSNMLMQMPKNYAALCNDSDIRGALKYALLYSTPEGAQRRPLYLGSLRHQCVVFFDHNPLSYALKGIPNAHLDHLLHINRYAVGGNRTRVAASLLC